MAKNKGSTRDGGRTMRLDRAAKALKVDANWLRTGQGCAIRRLTEAGDEAEALALARALGPAGLEAWLATGRAIHLSMKDL